MFFVRLFYGRLGYVTLGTCAAARTLGPALRPARFNIKIFFWVKLILLSKNSEKEFFCTFLVQGGGGAGAGPQIAF